MSTLDGKELAIQRWAPQGDSTVEADPDNWKYLCGAMSGDFSIDNEILRRSVRADCQDMTSKIITIAAYGAQTISFGVSGLTDTDAEGAWLEQAAFNQTRFKTRVVHLGKGVMYVATETLFGNFRESGQAENDTGLSFTAQVELSGTITRTVL